jgi:hypothetical protein
MTMQLPVQAAAVLLTHDWKPCSSFTHVLYVTHAQAESSNTAMFGLPGG